MYNLGGNVKEPQQEQALLLYQAGPKVYNILKTLSDTGYEKGLLESC